MVNCTKRNKNGQYADTYVQSFGIYQKELKLNYHRSLNHVALYRKLEMATENSAKQCGINWDEGKKRRNFYEEEFKVDCSSISICIDI